MESRSDSFFRKALFELTFALKTHNSSRWHEEQSQNFLSNYSGGTAVMSHGGDAAAG